VRVREGPSRVVKALAFEHRIGERAAVGRDEGSRSTWATKTVRETGSFPVSASPLISTVASDFAKAGICPNCAHNPPRCRPGEDREDLVVPERPEMKRKAHSSNDDGFP
jgi:hypothetical protein